MPLSLGIPEDQPKVVTWEPTIEGTNEATEYICKLLKKGYTYISYDSSNGVAKLNPPLLAKNVGLMRVISENGDDRIVWDRNNPDEVRDAARKFKELTEDKNHTAYYARTDGKKGEQMHEFDPFSEEAIILVPDTRPG